MKKNIDKQLENIAHKMVKEMSLESPSSNFTAHVMKQIDLLSSKKAIVYKPLISKPVWIFIVLGFIVTIGYLIFGTSLQESDPLFTINFEAVFNNRFTEALSAIKFSNTLTYAIVFFAMMVFIQIPLLKNYFEKRLV